MKKFLGLLFLTVLVFCFVKVVGAVPTLQLYIEDGTYYDYYEIDNGKDTYEVTESWFTDDNPFCLTIAGASKNGHVDTISDVTLWIAFKEEPGEGTITVMDSDGFIVNPIIWQDAQEAQEAQQGIPDPPGWEEAKRKTNFPTHGVYPSYYYAYDLPDLNVKDGNDDIYDYNNSYGPNSTPSDTGVLQTYQITYSGYYWLHMDLTGVAWKGNNDKPAFAPFSHDADGPPSPNPVPEPSTMLLFGFGLLSLFGVGLKSSNCSTPPPFLNISQEQKRK